MADQKTKAEGFVKISTLVEGLVSEAVQAYSLRSGNDPFYETQPRNIHTQTDQKLAEQPQAGSSKPRSGQTPAELNCVQRDPSKGKSNA